MTTKTDLAQTVAHDHRPSTDGCSNSDRTRFIMEVFECETFDIDAPYDFANIMECKDLDMVEACKHLALLQMQYHKECVDYGLADPTEVEVRMAFLTLSIQRMNWHLEHLGMGRRTPPCPFLN